MYKIHIIHVMQLKNATGKMDETIRSPFQSRTVNVQQLCVYATQIITISQRPPPPRHSQAFAWPPALPVVSLSPPLMQCSPHADAIDRRWQWGLFSQLVRQLWITMEILKRHCLVTTVAFIVYKFHMYCYTCLPPGVRLLFSIVRFLLQWYLWGLIFRPHCSRCTATNRNQTNSRAREMNAAGAWATEDTSSLLRDAVAKYAVAAWYPICWCCGFGRWI